MDTEEILNTKISKKSIVDVLIEQGYIKKEYGFVKIKKVEMSHGECCCCRDCGQFHDDCVCGHNEWIDIITNL